MIESVLYLLYYNGPKDYYSHFCFNYLHGKGAMHIATGRGGQLARCTGLQGCNRNSTTFDTCIIVHVFGEAIVYVRVPGVITLVLVLFL